MKSLHTYAGDPRHHADDIAELRAEVEALRGEVELLHTPITEEAECWGDGDDDMQREHSERFPECDPTNCEGHTFDLQVCTECGYTTGGEYVMYRRWPCATLRAFARPTLR